MKGVKAIASTKAVLPLDQPGPAPAAEERDVTVFLRPMMVLLIFALMYQLYEFFSATRRLVAGFLIKLNAPLTTPIQFIMSIPGDTVIPIEVALTLLLVFLYFRCSKQRFLLISGSFAILLATLLVLLQASIQLHLKSITDLLAR